MVLIAGAHCTANIALEVVKLIDRERLLLVNGIGKPAGASTYGILADIYVNAVSQKGKQNVRIDSVAVLIDIGKYPSNLAPERSVQENLSNTVLP